MIRTQKKSRAERAKRRAWRTAKGHGLTRQQEKDALTVAERLHRAAVRTQVWARSLDTSQSTFALCDLCGDYFADYGAGEMHESPSRAQTRGLPPEQRFSLEICSRVHTECHQQVTERRWRVVFDDAVARFMGGYTVRDWVTGRPLYRMKARRVPPMRERAR